MKTKFKILSLATILAVSTIFPMSVNAANTVEDNAVVSKELVNVQGVPVTFTLYNSNGVYSETVSIGKNQTRQLSDYSKEELFKQIEIISDERAQSIYSTQTAPSPTHDEVSSRAPHTHWTESKHNAAYGTGTGENKNTYAGHWSEIDYCVLDTAGSMEAYDGASRVLYGGDYVVDAMSLKETITSPSFSVYIAYPLGFSVSATETSATLDSYWDGNNYMCTQYRNNFDAQAVVYSGSYAKIKTQTQVYISNSSFSSTVNSTW